MPDIWDEYTWRNKSTGGLFSARSNSDLLAIDKMVASYHGRAPDGRSKDEHQAMCLAVIAHRASLYLTQDFDKGARKTAVTTLLNQVLSQLKVLKSKNQTAQLTQQSFLQKQQEIQSTSNPGFGYRDTKALSHRRYEMEAQSPGHIPGSKWVGDDPTSGLMAAYRDKFKSDDPFECLKWVTERGFEKDKSVRYFNEHERQAYLVNFNGAALVWAHGGGLLHSIGLKDGPDKLIFVISRREELFAAESIENVVHHSSFLEGEPVLAAGQLEVNNGQLISVSNVSGHYKPDDARHYNALLFFQSRGLDPRLFQSEFMSQNGLEVQSAFEQLNELIELLDWQDEAHALYDPKIRRGPRDVYREPSKLEPLSH